MNRTLSFSARLLAGIALAAAPLASAAAADAWLKLGSGRQIEVQSWSWGQSNVGTSVGARTGLAVQPGGGTAQGAAIADVERPAEAGHVAKVEALTVRPSVTADAAGERSLVAPAGERDSDARAGAEAAEADAEAEVDARAETEAGAADADGRTEAAVARSILAPGRAALGLPDGERGRDPLAFIHAPGGGSLTVKARFAGCAAGTRYGEAVLGTPAARFEMKDVVISGCAADSVTLSYAAMRDMPAGAPSR